jgi:hypothetical protein
MNTMHIRVIVGADGSRHDLSPLTYEEFLSVNMWQGMSDVAFDQWLRHNNFQEVCEFREEFRKTAHIETIIVNDRPIEFNPSGDGETWTGGGALEKLQSTICRLNDELNVARMAMIAIEDLF